MSRTTAEQGETSTWERLIPPESVRRRLFQRLLGLGDRPIVLASMSRAGSSMLFRAVHAGWAAARFGPRAEAMRPYIWDYAWRLDETPLIPGVVYKTHDLAEHAPRRARPKVLFTFRRASEVALSIAARREREGPKWFARHLAHMRGSGAYTDFLSRDTLGLEAQVDGWFAAADLDILGIRYDDLWKHRSEIEDFLGFSVRLSKRVSSTAAAVPPEQASLIRATYAALDRKIDALPPVFFRSAGRT